MTAAEAEEEWRCERSDCELDAESHSLAMLIEHTFAGEPSVTGRNFDAEEAAEVAERILERLAR